MLQRYNSFLFVAIALVVAAVIGLNLPGGVDEASQDYFIKPVPRNNLVVVEPNYGRLFHEGETEAEAVRHVYDSLPEIQEDFKICQTKLIEFERKGKTVPNLYVYVEASDAKKVLANKAADKSSS